MRGISKVAPPHVNSGSHKRHSPSKAVRLEVMVFGPHLNLQFDILRPQAPSERSEEYWPRCGPRSLALLHFQCVRKTWERMFLFVFLEKVALQKGAPPRRKKNKTPRLCAL